MDEKGYNLLRVKNTFIDDKISYKGLNNIFSNSNGYKFEFQFHTATSVDVKMKSHEYYEEFRKDKTTNKRKIELQRLMNEESKRVKTPNGIEKIKNKEMEDD